MPALLKRTSRAERAIARPATSIISVSSVTSAVTATARAHSSRASSSGATRDYLPAQAFRNWGSNALEPYHASVA